MPLVSFTSPLTADQTVVSTAQNLTRATRITGTVYADEPGALYIEQGGDGTNWDSPTEILVPAGVGEPIDVDVIADYWRVRYVNGDTAQSAFRLYAYARDPYGAFIAASIAPSAGGAWGVLRWNSSSSTYTYVGRFDGLDGFSACGNAAVATNQAGKYAAFQIANATVSDETLFRSTEHAPDSF